jgi:hypothetical protein
MASLAGFIGASIKLITKRNSGGFRKSLIYIYCHMLII